jgi:SAM-dependent methyltransferase
VDIFLGLIELSPELSVLEVGCGPGTLALPIARQVGRVTALDYSQGMLELLNKEAESQGIDNVTTVHCDWEDEWSEFGVEPHDLVLASRSMNIADLSGALQKIGRYATQTVHVAERIAPSPFDPTAFAALGREFSSGPDYIYTLNMCYQLGIHPRISHIELSRDQQFASLDAAVEGYAWMFRDLSTDERNTLEHYVKDRIVARDGDYLTVRRDHAQRWALLSWSTQKRPPR